MKTSTKYLLPLTAVACFGIEVPLKAQAQPAPPGMDTHWKVGGYRHGPSYFKKTYLVETTPLVAGEWDFQHYHTYEEMVTWYKKWAVEYSGIVDVYVTAQGFAGTDIYQLTVTNKQTGRAVDKPAMFIDANRHSGEVTAGQSAYWMLHHMLTNYGSDPEITRLIDNFTFYFRPTNNPDGSDLYLQTAQTLRSTIRPVDNDRDGLLDEDPAEDLDGDGFIRQMRVNVGMGEGNMVIDERDPKGRLMRRVGQGEGDYIVVSEGIDNDGDGRVNEDGVGGLDLHRNYPENWRPMTEETGRGWTQGGAGAFPMSEPETASLVMFVLTHPHISVMNTMDTTVPMHLRGPSTSGSEERMYPDDLELFKYFDARGLEITGYGRAGDVYNDYGGGNPLFGHSPDFGYFYYGSIWYGDELWNGGRLYDYDEDGTTDDWDTLQYHDNELTKSRFQEWTPVIHPVYGDAEVGGWNPKFWRQNPPPELLEEWAEKQARFNLMLASHLPHVVIHEPTVYSASEGEYLIEVDIENDGFIPTALRQAQLVKIVRPDTLTLEFPDGVSTSGGGRGGRGGRGRRGGGRRGGGTTPPAQGTGVQILSSRSIDLDRILGNETKTLTFKVRLNQMTGTAATLRYSSTRGGVVTRELHIGN